MFRIHYALAFPVHLFALNVLKNKDLAKKVDGYLAHFWLIISGLVRNVKYKVPLDKNQAYVICCNHTSYYDTAAMHVTFPRGLFVGKSDLGKIPVFGYVYKRLYIVFDRENMHSGARALMRMVDVLRKGTSVLIFPEGRTSDIPPDMYPFQGGAFRAAIQAGVPILPVTMLSLWNVVPKYPRNPPYKDYKHRIDMIVHAPIPTDGMTKKDVPALQKSTYDIIRNPLIEAFPSLFPTVEKQQRT